MVKPLPTSRIGYSGVRSKQDAVLLPVLSYWCPAAKWRDRCSSLPASDAQDSGICFTPSLPISGRGGSSCSHAFSRLGDSSLLEGMGTFFHGSIPYVPQEKLSWEQFLPCCRWVIFLLQQSFLLQEIKLEHLHACGFYWEGSDSPGRNWMSIHSLCPLWSVEERFLLSFSSIAGPSYRKVVPYLFRIMIISLRVPNNFLCSTKCQSNIFKGNWFFFSWSDGKIESS